MSFEKIVRSDPKGRFQRKESEFRDWIKADGSTPYRPEADRYHLYVAWACPWAHRTLLMRKLLGLEEAVSFSVVHPLMDERGAWWFAPEEGYDDPVNGARTLQDIYQKADPGFDGIGTVPVLWDRKKGTIMNNESREIMRMMDTTFQEHQKNDVTFLPEDMEKQVDGLLDAIYQPVNNGVYRVGFARTQEAHDEAVTELFEALAHWEDVLSGQRYLAGDVLTEADWALFVTLLRFDPVYHYHFKCNLRRLRDYPNMWDYVRELYQYPGVRETVDMADTKRHYYGSHKVLNPLGIVPKGPMIDLEEPHGRDKRLPVERPVARRRQAVVDQSRKNQ